VGKISFWFFKDLFIIMKIIFNNFIMTHFQSSVVEVDKALLEEYSVFIDIVSHERDKIFWNYIKSDSFDELTNYLDK